MTESYITGRETSGIRDQQFREIQRRRELLERWFHEFFDGTAMFDPEKPWTEDDVKRAEDFLERAVSIGHERLNPSFVGHCFYSGMFFRVLVELYLDTTGEGKQYTPEQKSSLLHQVHVAGILHDLDKIVIAGEYLVGNMMVNSVARRLRVNPKILKILDPITREFGFNEKIMSIYDLSWLQRLHRISDNFGKLREGNVPLTREEFKEYFSKQIASYSGNPEGTLESISYRPWKLTRFGLKKLSQGVSETYELLTLMCVDWFYKKTGILVNEAQEQALKLYNESYKDRVEWMQIYFDPRIRMRKQVRELLGFPELQWVIFDAGNVLIDDPGDRLWEKVKEGLKTLPGFSSKHEDNFNALFVCEEDKQSRMDLWIEKTMNGSMTLEEFLYEFYSSIGMSTSSDTEKALNIFLHPKLYNPIPGMQDIVRHLVQNGIRVAILSDCSNFVVPVVKARLLALYPEISEKCMLFSSEINSAKRDPNTGAFQIALKRLDIANPRTTLFIDDKMPYIMAAIDNLIRTYHFPSADMSEALANFLTSQGVRL